MNFVQHLTDDALAIFLFHGVVERSDYQVRNYTGKHVLREDFAQLIGQLREAGTPLSMPDVVERTQCGLPFPPRSFAVTFDDGFANNYHIAAPILRRFEVPATIYVTTAFIDENQMSWIDRIEYCLELAKPGTLALPWLDEPVAFAHARDKIELLNQIRKRVKHTPTLDADALVADIFGQCGIEEVQATADPLDQKMTWAEVRALNEDPLFTIGGHTHRHRVLSFLEPEALEEEVSLSLELLRQRAAVGPEHYSYPEGLAHCYSDAVIASLRAHGVVCCPTAEAGLNRDGASLFHLRRIMVG